MKQIKPDDLKGKINHLEKETKRLCNRRKDYYSKKTKSFETISNVWIIYYSYLNLLSKDDYLKYLQKMDHIAKIITDYTILNKR